jgi:DNA-binding response OmpR family regulator
MPNKKILIIDDGRDLFELVRIRVEANDYETITAYDGHEALEKARKEKPDLIILDLMLPKMSLTKRGGIYG